MRWTPTQKEMEAVLKLDGPDRYQHFVKKVADNECVWSLWNDGWALMGDDSGNELVPIWPHSEYAKLSASGAWQGYVPREIDLDTWLEKWTPGMQKDGRKVAVFPTPSDKGIVAPPEQLAEAIRDELGWYE